MISQLFTYQFIKFITKHNSTTITITILRHSIKIYLKKLRFVNSEDADYFRLVSHNVNCSLTYELPFVGGVTDFLRLCRIACNIQVVEIRQSRLRATVIKA